MTFDYYEHKENWAIEQGYGEFHDTTVFIGNVTLDDHSNESHYITHLIGDINIKNTLLDNATIKGDFILDGCFIIDTILINNTDKPITIKNSSIIYSCMEVTEDLSNVKLESKIQKRS